MAPHLPGQHRIRLFGVLVAVAGLVALAGCSSGSSSSPPSDTGAPAIGGDPLDMTGQAAQPCRLLTADQLAQYHLGSPGHLVANACVWTATVAGLPSYTARIDLTSGGLTGLYRERSRLAVFQPTVVGEYPAVRTAASRAALTAGQCTIEVGVANDTLIIARITVPKADTPDYTDPCDPLAEFTADIVANGQGRVA
jgi:hypothetical protein